MSHAYRLHTNGSQTLDGWDTSRQYDSKQINSIVDPSGATASLPITSVPTPFASLELARDAFEICGSVDNRTGKNNIEGNSIYHKLVSYSLDTLEIFFNYKKLSHLFDIIAWDASTEINALIQSMDVAHQRLGQTLSLYLNQDSGAFNFASNTVFYLLNYKNGPAPLNIIGGTSPTSLAVASTNNLSYVDVHLSGNHKAYDEDPANFRTLIQRDFEFVKYVWTLSLQYGFSTVYPEVYKYIQECYKSIPNQVLKQELLRLTPSDIDNYEPIIVGAARINMPGGVVIGTYTTPDPRTTSDFAIMSDYTGRGPLVLPNETGYNDPAMRYVSGPWNPKTRAPYYDASPMESRVLPDDNTPCPYLTVDDIFQPYIIKTIFPISSDSYFLGNYSSNKGYSYLLPLKKEVFKYLSIETICGTTSGAHAKPLFELKDLAGGGVEAVINIPVQKGRYIMMRRRYMQTDDDPNVQENKGIVVECSFDLYLYPSYHIKGDDILKPQRAYIVDGDWRDLTMHYEYNVELFSCRQYSGNNLVTSCIKRADKRSGLSMTSKIFLASEEYDIISVSNGFAEGILIPKFAQVGGGSDSYEFAIDFGTTNTHVEYRVNKGNIIKPLEMLSSDSAVLAMHPNTDEYSTLFMNKYLPMFIDAPYQELLPTTFGVKDVASFPLRTNICTAGASGSEDNLRTKYTLGDYSIGFHYEKKNTFLHNRVLTNLKWLGDGTQKYVSSFFEELLLIIRSKVLINGGSLKNTKITWFYPVSMEPYRLSQLRSEWERLCYELIDQNCPIKSVTESLAPFYYYKNSEGVNAAYRPVVLMDIGGGTTDFAVYEGNKPTMISSVRFAGNSIYGDFPGFGINMNGFYNKYFETFKTKISNSPINSLLNAFNDVVNNGISADFVSFLYSLEKNPELQKNNISISFSEELKNDYNMKTSLLLFYVAEIYYLANVLKSKGIGTPAYLTISGTASKVLDVIGGQKELEGLARVIFNDIIGDDGKVELKRVNNPKEITCKGGLSMRDEDVVDDSDELRYCFTASPSLERKNMHLRLKDVDSQAMSEVMTFYRNFVEYFFGLNSKFSFEKKFGIQTQRNFDAYKDILLEHAQEDLAAVLDVRKAERNDPDAELEDSLFFFPLTGGLNRLSYYISNQ